MPPNKKGTTKFPRTKNKAVNIDPKVYEMLIEMAKAEDRPIKTQLERIIKDASERFVE